MNKKLVVAIAALLGSSAVMADNAAAVYGGYTSYASQDVDQVGTGGSANTSGFYSGYSDWDSTGGTDAFIGGEGFTTANLEVDAFVVSDSGNVPPVTIVYTTVPVSGSAFAGQSMGSVAQTSVDDETGTIEGSVGTSNSSDIILTGTSLGGSWGYANLESIAGVDTGAGAPWGSTLDLYTDSDTLLCVNPTAANNTFC